MASLLFASLPGCGAIFHSSQTITIATVPGAKAYQGGVPLKPIKPGKFEAKVFLNRALGDLVVIAPGMKVKRVVPDRYVDALAIIFDILWTATIVGVAAPLTDALLGTFTKRDSDPEVELERLKVGDNGMPVYSIEGTVVTASEDAPPPPVAPPPTAPPEPPPPPPTKPPPRR